MKPYFHAHRRARLHLWPRRKFERKHSGFILLINCVSLCYCCELILNRSKFRRPIIVAAWLSLCSPKGCHIYTFLNLILDLFGHSLIAFKTNLWIIEHPFVPLETVTANSSQAESVRKHRYSASSIPLLVRIGNNEKFSYYPDRTGN